MTTTQNQTAIATNNDKRGIEGYLLRAVPQMRQVATRYLSPERLIRLAMVARVRVPHLAQCTPESLLVALMEAAQLGLEPNTPLDHAALVPLRNKHTGHYEAEFWPMYKGLIELASRSFGLRSARAVPIYEGEKYEIVEGLHPTITHTPNIANRGPDKIVLVYAVAQIPGGDPAWDWMSKAEIEQIRRRSRAANDGPWVTDYTQMAKKTVLRRLLTQLPLSSAAQEFLRHDEAKTGDAQAALGGDPFAIDAPLEPGSSEPYVDYDPGYEDR